MAARILIVHDKKSVQEEMRAALSGGHEVTVASDAHDAMLILKKMEDMHLDGAPLELIISCVHIDAKRDMTVFDLLKWSRGNPQISKVPFILICSEPSSMAKSLIDSVRLAGHALGASAYMIMEDFDAKAFLAQIEYYLPPELRTLDQDEQTLEQAVIEALPDHEGNGKVTEQAAIKQRKKLIGESKQTKTSD